MNILPNGDSALLLEFEALEEVLAFYRGAVDRPTGVIDMVPGARTLLATVDPRVLSLTDLRAWIGSVEPRETTQSVGAVVDVPTRYDGADLGEVAALLDITEGEVVDLHTASTWTVAFTGFAPGFGYLVTDHPRLHVPRRTSPRTEVPAGSVGLAGEFSGIYPRTSPGGWQLIGITDVVLFDPDRDPPALLAPGTTVRFVGA